MCLDDSMDLDDDERSESHEPKSCMSRQVLNTLYEMQITNKYCDATIKIDGSSFGIHRAIMCSISDYFRALFANSEPNKLVEVFIPGIREPIMRAILDYAYKRECHIDGNNVHELLTIADYVGMLGVVSQCKHFLAKNLTPENCIGTMLFARSRFCEDLYAKSRLYILRNFIEVSIKSEELMKIGLNDFEEIISDDLLNTKDEESVWNVCVRWIDYDPDNRAGYVGRLLQGVRLGLMQSSFFMEKVKDHPYVKACEATKALIIETITFMCDLDMISSRTQEIRTPALALPRLPHEVMFAIGGWSEGSPSQYIETYDTRADRWVRVLEEDPAGPRAYHGTAVIGFKIYCIGGFDGSEYFNTCRVFDAVKKTWKEVSPMHTRRCYVSVTALDGLIYAMGGYDGQNRLNTVERYDPKTNQWTMITTMNMQRSDASACALNGKVYITGGFNGTECMNTAECFDPNTNVWTPIPNMITRRSGVSCVSFRGQIFVIGGFNGIARMSTGERYDPETELWTPIREMSHPRSNFGMEIIDDMIFAIGGFNGVTTILHTECYVVETDEWLEATNMGIVRSALSVSALVGLPNMRDYIHKDRSRLIEERRQRMFPIEVQHHQNRDISISSIDVVSIHSSTSAILDAQSELRTNNSSEQEFEDAQQRQNQNNLRRQR